MKRKIIGITLLAMMVVGVAMTASAETNLQTQPPATDCTLIAGGGSVCDEAQDTPLFRFPQPFENSYIERTWYAKLHDNVNVYAAPNHGAHIVRNAGDGFLYVTLHSRTAADGGDWYEINPAEYVHESDLTVVQASEHTGLVVNSQPERPFGWIVAPARPSTAPGVEADQTFAKLPRYHFFQVYDAVEDDEGWLWYNIGWGRWIKQTLVSLVDISDRPDEVGENDLWVEVDLYEQTFAAYEGDRMVYTGLISSGLSRWPTYEGLYQVEDRWEYTKMSGAEGKVDYYFVEDVPFTMYFDIDTGMALHGAYWHDRFGYKHSHGCVNMPIRDAEWVFNWSAESEEALWVWAHTSEPTHYFDKFGGELSRDRSAAYFVPIQLDQAAQAGALQAVLEREPTGTAVVNGN